MDIYESDEAMELYYQEKKEEIKALEDQTKLLHFLRSLKFEHDDYSTDHINFHYDVETIANMCQHCKMDTDKVKNLVETFLDLSNELQSIYDQLLKEVNV